MDAATEARHLELAVRLAAENGQSGQLPFGAVVVRGGEVVTTGVNTTLRDHDPTAHAEVAAIRAACRQIGTTRLTDAVVVSSCEPCPMCHVAAVVAGVTEMVYAATSVQAAEHGFVSLPELVRIRDRLADVRRAHLRHVPTPGNVVPFRSFGGIDGTGSARP
ncbi:tRNA(Arg) A34 adenosine deaminase TadA [Pseudonocardia hierapolitana]|uniref:tRNA(Arg) A34 adenosine deaminase TadA n=1 Tax=Pseudonocardia hierapolitana TaxID=1128676 RepID=A0A561SJG3_9PSEU|nr:nucleoside deaminase [Pseudonocardia hierapolitana]TWF74962.1 tRNA(Arg) A34 adenosine deaminase TadA [Pseudonocardia hierapolitana]